MKSGLEGRNNDPALGGGSQDPTRLNEVRPRRPEQSVLPEAHPAAGNQVSMKSGLEGRNNRQGHHGCRWGYQEVSMKSGLEGRNNGISRRQQLTLLGSQ